MFQKHVAVLTTPNGEQGETFSLRTKVTICGRQSFRNSIFSKLVHKHDDPVYKQVFPNENQA